MYARASFVHDVDGLVGEEAVGDVAAREGHARLQGLLRIAHLVVAFVVGRDVAQDLERLIGRSRLHHDLLEAAFEGRVALDVLAVLVERGGSDGLQFAARQRRFEDVGRVETALRRACTHDGVDLVDEDDRILRLAQFVEQLLHALLEFAAEFRAGHQRRDVEREERLVGDGVGHFAACDAQGQSLDDGALAHAGFADQDRVVLLAARKNLDYALDLLLAPHDGVDFAFAGHAREVHAEFVEQVRRGFLFGFVLFVEVEHVHLNFGAEVVAHGELLEVFVHYRTRYAVHLQYARGSRRAVADDGPQRVGRRNAPCGARTGPQLFGEGAVELFWGLGRALLPGEHFAFDAQAYLVEFPVLETGG